jgi:nucleotide-binding universal stress UspA family protein
VFTSIVVPVDLEPDGDRALPLAGALARAAGIPLELVSVSSPHMPEVPDRVELEERARAAADHWSVTVLHDNDVVAALAAFAASRPDALFLMATRARGALGQRLLGSVTEGLLSRLSQPMLLVGPRVELHEQVDCPGLLVGVDGSPATQAVLPAVATWTRTFDGPAPWLVEVTGTGADREAARRADVQRWAGRLARAGVPAQWDVARSGNAADGLIEMADRMADVVVVVVSTRWTDPDHAHHRSVARRLTHRSHHPVLVVPATRDQVAPVDVAST